ncbi:hypothetical protein ACHQM5_004247 [Ranunculus cassubicifolius]
MASLQQLLAEEGFEHRKKPPPKLKNRRLTHEKSVALPIYICYDRKSSDFSRQKSVKKDGASMASVGSVFSSSRSRRTKSEILGSKTELEMDQTSLYSTMQREPRGLSASSSSKGMIFNKNELEFDEIAVKAVISILSGYIGKFMKDKSFRETLRQKCDSCLSTKLDKQHMDNKVIENLRLGMKKTERLVENSLKGNELKVKSMSNSIRLLNIVVLVNSPDSKNGTTYGVPNAYLSACAELYLAILYKLQKKDRVCARHLLQMFFVSPFLARTHLLPELWERFFLPHLLHLKVWYTEEVDFVSNLSYVEKERRLKIISKAYNDRTDVGTKQFALYYKEWIKIGDAKAPPIPSVALPSMSSLGISERRSPGSFTDQPSPNKNLLQVVFGPNYERRTQSMDFGKGNGGGILSDDTWSLEEERNIGTRENSFKLGCFDHRVKAVNPRLSSQICMNQKAELWPATNKPDYLRVFSCRNEPSTCFFHENRIVKDGAIRKELNNHQNLPSSNFSNAITTICSSDILVDCEIAIRVVTKSWLDGHGDPVLESSLSKSSVIEGILEILLVSKDDEILELAISILAELVSRSEACRQIILFSDPQLEIFVRLLKNSSLFLKTSVLVYLLKPKAKQMLSVDWIPLVLRVLEFGDQLQTLFTVRCSSQVAAFYLLEQLLTGFDVEINIENARKLVSLGGLSMLVRRLETGGHSERSNAALFITSCIQADGSCRQYIANNVKKSSILELLVIRNQETSTYALSLLVELLCFNRKQAIKFLNELKTDGGYLNIMHILLVYLQRAPLEQRPLIAAVLLQLDLLGDHLQFSVYREEVMDAMVEALDCKRSNKEVQEQSGRALLLLGGCFSRVGKASVEKWLLKQAGFDENTGELLYEDKEIVGNEVIQLNEEAEETEGWIRKAATVLLMNGNKRLLTALSESIKTGIPCLARASLVTVAWMSSSLQSIEDAALHSMACSLLAPCLLESLNYDRQLEERVLASLSLLRLVKNSDCQSIFPQLDKGIVSLLRNLSLVTWTAEELLAIVMNGSNQWYSEQEIVSYRSDSLRLHE